MGHLLEELVVQIYMKKTGEKPYAVRKMFRHPKYPFMLADCDYFVWRGGKLWCVECKTSFSYNHDEWKDGGVPYHYQLQGRHYAAVANTAGTIFLCLYGNSEDSIYIREVERDLSSEEDLIAMEANFWNNYVEKQVPPPLKGDPELAVDFLKRYLKRQQGQSILLPDSCRADIQEYLRLKEEKSEISAKGKELDKKIKAASVGILKAMNGSEKGYIAIGGKEYEAGYTRRSSVSILKDDMEKLRIAHPDVYEKYSQKKISESFYIKERKGQILKKAS